MNLAETLHGLVFDDEPKSTQAPKATPQPSIAPKPILSSNSQPVNQSGLAADSVDQSMVEMLRTRLQSCYVFEKLARFTGRECHNNSGDYYGQNSWNL